MAKIKIRLKRLLNLPPKVWGAIFILIIPLFALLYQILPADNFNQPNANDNFFSSLYFSVVTITTLGFGEIFPVSVLARTIVMVETCAGMLTIGLFLNAVAVLKSRIDMAAEIEKQNLIRRQAEAIKLSRHYKLLEKDILQYVRTTTIITTPMNKRCGGYSYNPEFTFQDMHDMYQPSRQFKDSLIEPAINAYYRSQQQMADRLELALLNIDLSYWPKLEADILQVLQNIKDYDAQDFIISQYNTTGGGKRMSEYNADMIRDWNQDIEYVPHSVISPYIALYKLIKQNMPLLLNIMGEINQIITESAAHDK